MRCRFRGVARPGRTSGLGDLAGLDAAGADVDPLGASRSRGPAPAGCSGSSAAWCGDGSATRTCPTRASCRTLHTLMPWDLHRSSLRGTSGVQTKGTTTRTAELSEPGGRTTDTRAAAPRQPSVRGRRPVVDRSPYAGDRAPRWSTLDGRRRCRDDGDARSATSVRAHAGGDQPAQRLPGARRRHRHQHGPHPRRRRGRARRRAAPTLAATCNAISHGSLMGARGNSGVILSQILRGIAATLERRAATSTAPTVADGPAPRRPTPPTRRCCKPVEGTILTVVREAAERPRRRPPPAADLAGGARGGPRRRREACSPAPPSCSRCSREAGVVDAGGAGFLLLLDAASTSSTASRCPSPSAGGPTRSRVRGRRAAARAASTASGDVSDLRYEVMYFLDARRRGASATSRTRGAGSATRSWSSAATASGTATSTPTTSAPPSRPRSTSAGARTHPRHRPARAGRDGGALAREAADGRRAARRPTLAEPVHVRGGGASQRATASRQLFARARRAGGRHAAGRR